MEKEYFTMKETSERLGVSAQTLRVLAKKGELPTLKIGRSHLVHKSFFEAKQSSQPTVEENKSEGVGESPSSSPHVLETGDDNE